MRKDMLSWWDKVKSGKLGITGVVAIPFFSDFPIIRIELGLPGTKQADSLPQSNAYICGPVKCSSGPYWSPHI